MFNKNAIDPISSYFHLPLDGHLNDRVIKIVFLIDWASALGRNGKTIYSKVYTFENDEIEVSAEFNIAEITMKLCENVENLSYYKSSVEDKYIAYVRNCIKNRDLQDIFLDTFPIKHAILCNTNEITLESAAKEYTKIFS